MSAIISVCGTNFCTLVSDGRSVSYDEDGNIDKILSDNTHKIFKLNNNLILGITGKFIPNEKLLKPFENIIDLKSMSIEIAIKALLDYLEKRKHMLLQRNYILGGKDNNGDFCIQEIHFNNGGESFTPKIYKPKDGFFVVRMATPLLEKDANLLLEKHIKNTMPWNTHNNLKNNMYNFIKEVSKMDKSVGGEIFEKSIF